MSERPHAPPSEASLGAEARALMPKILEDFPFKADGAVAATTTCGSSGGCCPLGLRGAQADNEMNGDRESCCHLKQQTF